MFTLINLEGVEAHVSFLSLVASFDLTDEQCERLNEGDVIEPAPGWKAWLN